MHVPYAALSLSLACLAGCGGQSPCNRNVHDNEKFEVTVVGQDRPPDHNLPLHGRDAPPCGLDDIHVGDRFEVTLSERVQFGGENGCQVPKCPANFPTAGTPYENASWGEFLPYVCLAKETKIQLGPQCELGRFVGLYAAGSSGRLYAESDGGVPPPFTLLRGLGGTDDQAMCSDVMSRYPKGQPGSACVDFFQVTLTKR